MYACPRANVNGFAVPLAARVLRLQHDHQRLREERIVARWTQAPPPAHLSLRPKSHYLRGPRDHINIRILHSGFKAQDKGIRETMVPRILTFMWSFAPLKCWRSKVRCRLSHSFGSSGARSPCRGL